MRNESACKIQVAFDEITYRLLRILIRAVLSSTTLHWFAVLLCSQNGIIHKMDAPNTDVNFFYTIDPYRIPSAHFSQKVKDVCASTFIGQQFK